MKTKARILMLGVNTAWLSVLALAIAALPFTTRAGTFTSDFTKGVDTNYWGLWTSFPAGYCTNINDAQGVTFQRIAGSDRQNFSAGLGINMVNMRKITTNGFITGDFVVTMTYTNLNNFVSSSGDYFQYAGNQLKLNMQRGAGGSPESVQVVQVLSFSRNYPGFQTTDFQGSCVDPVYPWQGPQLLEIQPAALGNSATLKMARTNGVLSYYVNGQQIGVGEGPSSWTTSDLWSVNLALIQTLDAAHVGVTLQSCTISGPSVKDNAPVARPVLTLSPGGSGAISFGWDTILGRTYRVQSATNLVNPDWQPVGDPITATNSPTSVSYPVASESPRFYRVVTP
jgi:hypothetical protein